MIATAALLAVLAQEMAMPMHHLDHWMDHTGMVMHGNESILPRDCQAISADHEFTVRVGAKFAADKPGTVFGMSQHEFIVKPCSRVTVTLINTDEVRHQWMVHGLPGYLYPQGMFHIEAAGGHEQTGTFIVPGDDRTYLVHCDMAQHMEKGMKAQLKVGRGSGNLWGVPGITAAYAESSDPPPGTARGFVLALLTGIALGLAGLKALSRGNS